MSSVENRSCRLELNRTPVGDPLFWPAKEPEKRRLIHKPRIEELESKRSELSWLKSVVSEVDIGKLVESKRDGRKVVHANRNADVLRHYRRLAWGERSWLRYRWSNAILAANSSEADTYYFAGAETASKPFSLLMLDVDCHNKGTPEGAKALLEHLRDTCLPNLYFEPSTNGKGGHGYVLVERGDLSVATYKKLLVERLEPLLNQIARSFDVEFLELKGLPPERNWRSAKFDIETYKAGVLAKLPRGIINRFDELRNTTVVSQEFLLSLPRGEKQKLAPTVTYEKKEVVGSVSGRHIDDDQLEELEPGGKYHRMATKLLEGEELRTSSGSVVSVLDVALFLMLGEFFTKKMNSDGTLPMQRWKKLWTALKESGDISRSWDDKRWALIRNHLSRLGLIWWDDASYELGFVAADGTYVKGRATKWKFGEALMEKLAVETVPEPNESGKEEREHPLSELSLSNCVFELALASDGQFIKPFLALDKPVYLYSPPELNGFVGHTSSLAA